MSTQFCRALKETRFERSSKEARIMPRGKSAAMKSNDLEECCSLSRDVSTSLAVYPSKRAKSENAMRKRLVALIVSAKEFARAAGVDSLAFISHSPNDLGQR